MLVLDPRLISELLHLRVEGATAAAGSGALELQRGDGEPGGAGDKRGYRWRGEQE